MKKNLLILLFILPLFVHAQLTDNFSDGDFTTNPTWSGDVSKWQVNAAMLQSNSSVASDTFQLSTASTLASDAQWELFVKLDFSTSSNNWVDIYLTSDNADLKASLNGYFVRMGNTSDDISLYRRDGNIFTKIIDGVDGRSQPASANNLFKVKVIRTSANDWTLSDDNTGTGNNYFTEGTINDATYTTSAYFGFSIKQSTSSFFARHYFDDIYVGPIVLDIVPPVISSLTAVDSVHLDVKFSEAVDQVTAETGANYSADHGIGNPSSAVRDGIDVSLVHLTFTTPFSNGIQNILTINNVMDFSGNVIAASTTSLFTYHKPESVSPFDLVINEVLFNARTGGDEFIEIYNRSQKVIDLKNMKTKRRSLTTLEFRDSSVITTTSHLMLPGDYLVLSDDFNKVKSEYFTPDPDAYLNMNLQDLLTDSDIILLTDSSSIILDELHYHSSWHFPLLNDVDGVSLERLSPNAPTQDQRNWHSAAESVGFATPGYKNSEYDDSQGNGNEISVEPKIFSPDNDGYNDVVDVHYHFDNPGNVANVNVYDARGRLVRNLVNNELIGNDGSFVWDGVTNAKDKARVGTYIFYIEVYDLKGDTKNYKTTCVLASKL